jgi:hypothetical protein
VIEGRSQEQRAADAVTAPAPADGSGEAALRRVFESRFPGAVLRGREAFGGRTSFRLEVLSLELGKGALAWILLKDFGASQLPKEGLRARRERERGVYRDLLAGAGLGTAEYHGDVWEEAAGRFWLLLEYVEATELRSLKYPDWVRAAAWLGRLHGAFARARAELERREYLARHDAPFFRTQARLAARAAEGFPLKERAQVGKVLRGYESVIAVLAAQPRTLVHGSYRPQNILIGRGAAAGRVFAVDWELAALGAPLYDFAFLSDGFRPPQLEELWDAYRREAVPRGLALPESQEEMLRVVDCFRLHKTLKSLGDAPALNFSAKAVEKLAWAATELGERLGC